jgi:predicted NUDIX family NTP pyrophosphohydrolase
MAKQSAGILLYRLKNKKPEVFLCHPGGPFYKSKDLGAWTIPKGEFEPGEEALDAAKREFQEETGQEITGEFVPLKAIKYKSGKMVYCWTVEGDIDAGQIQCNLFSLEWPPKSGKYIDVPEIDRAAWFTIEQAQEKILPAQAPLLDDLLKTVLGK